MGIEPSFRPPQPGLSQGILAVSLPSDGLQKSDENGEREAKKAALGVKGGSQVPDPSDGLRDAESPGRAHRSHDTREGALFRERPRQREKFPPENNGGGNVPGNETLSRCGRIAEFVGRYVWTRQRESKPRRGLKVTGVVKPSPWRECLKTERGGSTRARRSSILSSRRASADHTRPDPPQPEAGPVSPTDGLRQLLSYRKSVYSCSIGFLEVPSATRYHSAPSFLNRNDTYTVCRSPSGSSNTWRPV